MSRRRTTEKVSVESSASYPVGVTVLVPSVVDMILINKKIVLGGTGAGVGTVALRVENGGAATDFLNVQVPSNDSECFPLEDFEVPKGSGISLAVTGAAVQGSLYYVALDDPTPITKEDARMATYVASVAGMKAIRTPSARAVGDES